VPTLGRARARELVQEALARAQAEGVSLADAVRGHAELARILSDADRHSLDDPRAYLGPAEILRRRLLASAPAASADSR